jgi:hypothetical protein
MAKSETIKLKTIALSNGSYEYKVLEVINRTEPNIGAILNQEDADELCMEAKRPYSNLKAVKFI